VSAHLVRSLPDVAHVAQPGLSGRLDWVGMGDIQAPVTLATEDGNSLRFPARVAAYVDLARPDLRGIHMSRLYLHVDQVLSAQALTPTAMRQLLAHFLASHIGVSGRALVRISFDYLMRRPALRSDNAGWKSYPVQLTAVLDDGRFDLELAVEAMYSSTCPASAALARQLIQQRFREEFAGKDMLAREQAAEWLGTEQGICATPHSQRSGAEVKVRLREGLDTFPIVALIDRIEGALKTPVQTAVKREDEQAFAGLNGTNLMFCEDAARRIQSALDSDEHISDFWLRASHYESLHPHNAVAVATKGVDGGYRGGFEP
jgi:GTP cyclohydrolase I